MPNAIFHIDGSNRPITLSVAEERGHHIQTSVTVNGVAFPIIENNILNLQVGTNATLGFSTIRIETTSLKASPAANSKVVFTLNGALEPHVTGDDVPYNGDTVVTHYMTYNSL